MSKVDSLLPTMETSAVPKNIKRLSRHEDLRAAAAASNKMDDDVESPSACNFPEMLAQDLELSEATFLSKNMTAGAPIRGLTVKEPRPLSVSIDTQSRHVHYEDALSKGADPTAADEGFYQSDSDDNGIPSDVASLTSDSGSDSGPEMEPPSVRMRQQSVCTAATSVTVHCNPPKEQPCYSFFTLEDSYQGQSWIDLDMEDSDDDDVVVAAQAALPGLTTNRPHDSAVILLDGPNLDTSQPSSGSKEDNLSSSGNAFSPSHPPLNRFSNGSASFFPPQRPHTSAGAPPSGKPRLVEITFSPRSRRRSSSHELCSSPSSSSLSETEPELVHTRASTFTTEASEFAHEILRTQSCPSSPVRRLTRAQERMPGPAVLDATPGRISSASGDQEDFDATMSEILDTYGEDQEDERLSTVESDDEDSVVALAERMSEIKIPEHLLKAVAGSPESPQDNPLGSFQVVTKGKEPEDVFCRDSPRVQFKRGPLAVIPPHGSAQASSSKGKEPETPSYLDTPRAQFKRGPLAVIPPHGSGQSSHKGKEPETLSHRESTPSWSTRATFVGSSPYQFVTPTDKRVPLAVSSPRGSQTPLDKRGSLAIVPPRTSSQFAYTRGSPSTTYTTTSQRLDTQTLDKGKGKEPARDTPEQAVERKSTSTEPTIDSLDDEVWYRSEVAPTRRTFTRRVASQATLQPRRMRASMPISDKILETLESTVKYFPDTMLSTKSLSIETIRAYAKKLKYNQSTLSLALSDDGDMAPHHPTTTSAKDKWKAFASLRNLVLSASTLTLAQPAAAAAHQAGGGTKAKAPTTAATYPAKNPMTAIFPGASPYVCDALYAHLVAYLYVSRLCGPDEAIGAVDSLPASEAAALARKKKRAARAQRRAAFAGVGGSIVEIPRKASAILGIGAASGSVVNLSGGGGAAAGASLSTANVDTSFNTSFNASTMTATPTPTPSPMPAAAKKPGKKQPAAHHPPKLARRVRSFFHFKTPAAAQRAEGLMVPADEQQPPLPVPGGGGGALPSRTALERRTEAVQAGLLRCVRNLVAKLRASAGIEAEGVLSVGDFTVPADGWKTLDPYLLRALCEVVKEAEENME